MTGERRVRPTYSMQGERRMPFASNEDFPSILMDVYHGRIQEVEAKIKEDPSLISVRSPLDEPFYDIGRMPRGTTPLLMACIRGHIQLVQWLLDHGGKSSYMRITKG
jgi:ankyrin repeat protein